MSCRSTWLAATSASSSEEDGRQGLLELRAVIEQANGMLMATFRCGPDEAPELLRRASRDGGVKVHVLAVKVAAQASGR
jgi:AmiR/NasT family two-component response regulator